MNGAESLVHTLLACGVDTCFANPGTSEMHFVAALDRIPGMHCVLGLFEGVVPGAADGYARIAGKPAATLLHCGPGLGNGLANLHNGRRGRTMMVESLGSSFTSVWSFRCSFAVTLPSLCVTGSILSMIPTRSPPIRTSLPVTRFDAFGSCTHRLYVGTNGRPLFAL